MADLLERKWALFSPLPLILGLGKRRDFMDRDVKQNIAENAPIENPPEGGACVYFTLPIEEETV